MRSPPWALATGVASLLCGCNGIAGIHEGILDPCANGCGGASAAGPSSSSASAATSSGAGTAFCGNGIIDWGEECDDGNSADHDGCTHCEVDCPGSGSFKDSIAHHCYRVNTSKLTAAQASVACQMVGAHLAAITSALELEVVNPHLPGDTWIGGSALAMLGIYTWSDGEPWGYAPWRAGEPNGAAVGQTCVKLAGPKPFGFADDDCEMKYPFLCERSPAGVAAP